MLLSLGYSTCHWCHVMEEESFDDEEIARFINENYVIVKVDREERPDVDAVYMSAMQLLAGGGGWPMTVCSHPTASRSTAAPPSRPGMATAASGSASSRC